MIIISCRKDLCLKDRNLSVRNIMWVFNKVAWLQTLIYYFYIVPPVPNVINYHMIKMSLHNFTKPPYLEIFSTFDLILILYHSTCTDRRTAFMGAGMVHSLGWQWCLANGTIFSEARLGSRAALCTRCRCFPEP